MDKSDGCQENVLEKTEQAMVQLGFKRLNTDNDKGVTSSEYNAGVQNAKLYNNELKDASFEVCKAFTDALGGNDNQVQDNAKAGVDSKTDYTRLTVPQWRALAANAGSDEEKINIIKQYADIKQLSSDEARQDLG